MIYRFSKFVRIKSNHSKLEKKNSKCSYSVYCKFSCFAGKSQEEAQWLFPWKEQSNFWTAHWESHVDPKLWQRPTARKFLRNSFASTLFCGCRVLFTRFLHIFSPPSSTIYKQTPTVAFYPFLNPQFHLNIPQAGIKIIFPFRGWIF